MQMNIQPYAKDLYQILVSISTHNFISSMLLSKYFSTETMVPEYKITRCHTQENGNHKTLQNMELRKTETKKNLLYDSVLAKINFIYRRWC
jgi:hypothetical protein